MILRCFKDYLQTHFKRIRNNFFPLEVFLRRAPVLRKKKRRQTFITKGDTYNLQEIYHSLNREYFEEKLDITISWFGKGKTIPKTRITFGSYNHLHKLIKVNRLLDKEEIPLYFVRYIVFHEMLHNKYPPIQKKKHYIHHSTFKRKEREFKEFLEAKSFIKEWKKNHFRKL